MKKLNELDKKNSQQSLVTRVKKYAEEIIKVLDKARDRRENSRNNTEK
jgi:hypothetical protein